MLTLLRVSLITVASLGLFTGCAEQNISNPSVATRTVERQTVGPTVYAESTTALGEKIVVAFGDGGKAFLREIKHGGDVVADSSGYLYIANNPVAVYSDAGKMLVQSFPVMAGPWNGVIAADGLGHFYVLGKRQHGEHLYLYEYQIGMTGPVREFSVAKNFSSITTDSSGNLYLGLGRSVLVYAPGSSAPDRTITKGIDGPLSLAVDPQGKLYVANDNFSKKFIHFGDIAVYAPRATSPSRKIINGITRPLVIHADSSGNLGVLNGGDTSSLPNITIYAAGSGSPSTVITEGIDAPTSFAFDSSNNVYVSNHGATYSDPGSITVYAAGTNAPTRTITKDVEQPDSVAVGP